MRWTTFSGHCNGVMIPMLLSAELFLTVSPFSSLVNFEFSHLSCCNKLTSVCWQDMFEAYWWCSWRGTCTGLYLSIKKLRLMAKPSLSVVSLLMKILVCRCWSFFIIIYSDGIIKLQCLWNLWNDLLNWLIYCVHPGFRGGVGVSLSLKLLFEILDIPDMLVAVMIITTVFFDGLLLHCFPLIIWLTSFKMTFSCQSIYFLTSVNLMLNSDLRSATRGRNSVFIVFVSQLL